MKGLGKSETGARGNRACLRRGGKEKKKKDKETIRTVAVSALHEQLPKAIILHGVPRAIVAIMLSNPYHVSSGPSSVSSASFCIACASIQLLGGCFRSFLGMRVA